MTIARSDPNCFTNAATGVAAAGVELRCAAKLFLGFAARQSEDGAARRSVRDRNRSPVRSHGLSYNRQAEPCPSNCVPLPRQNRSNMRSRSAAGMPGPRSATLPVPSG